tara:strand:- start:62 stop:232 length:171 start_codon:yes stop_codon:yes gene_type:complete
MARMQHTVKECNKKLVALLDKLNNLDTTRPDLRFQVDDAKVLARELSHETDFLGRD